MMAKMKFEIEMVDKVEEEKLILLADCKVNDVVLLANGVKAIVCKSGLAVNPQYRKWKMCLVMLPDTLNVPVIKVGGDWTQEAIAGESGGRIVEVLGTLTGIKVEKR